MTTSLKKVFLLGGFFHFAITFVEMFSDFPEDDLWGLLLNLFSSFMLIILAIVLVFFVVQIFRKKEPLFLNRFAEKFPTMSAYLRVIGCLTYINVIAAGVLLALYVNNMESMRKVLVPANLVSIAIFFTIF